MNHRVLELLKTPKNIQSEDLDLLKEEINSFPYVQNIRALYLYGVNLYDKENYQKVLSTTAAYTTDKKILYQLINGKIQQKPKPEFQPEPVKEKIIPAENPLKILHQAKASGFPLKRDEPTVSKPEIVENPQTEEVLEKKEKTCILPTPQPEIKHVYVNGERNRILFEGEENFLDDENVEKIDLESTLESGSIVTQKVEKKENVESVKEEVQQDEIVSETQDSEVVEEIPEFTPETIIEEEKTESEKEEIQDETQTSFHEVEPIDSQIEKEEIKEEEIISEDLGDTGTVEETADFTPEKIINEDKISSEKEEKTVRDDSELSFHGMESFLPEVKIQANNTEEISKEIPQSNINKHEDEMRRLIEEVEKKMKEKAVSEVKKEEKEPENISHDISFSETQSFDVKPTETKAQEKEIESIQTEIEEPKDEIVEEIAKPIAEESTQVTSSWKPMSFESHVPDSMLNKTVEIPQLETETKAPKFEEIQPEEIKIEEPKVIEQETEVTSEEEIEKESVSEVQNEEDKTEEKDNVPVMNVSFFGSDISKWTVGESKKEEENAKTAEKAEEVEKPIQKITPSILDSNVPGFINTWQSWLKIDRVEEAPEKEKIKTKAIETFIETNPRISQLKDESSYVVKEKNDDISHLMTETLATLYFEQKLYTKAIKAFEILIKKTPEKKEYFEGKIQEIKDFRSKG